MYKPERDWSDLERADKIVLITGVLCFLGMYAGLLAQNNAFHQIQKNAVKTEMVRGR